MEKKNKYIMNLGLAFDEDRAMKKLSQMAKEGWILEEMSLQLHLEPFLSTLIKRII